MHDSPELPAPRSCDEGSGGEARDGPDLLTRRRCHILESIFANLGEGIVVADVHERMVLFNPRAKQLLGTGPTEEPLVRWPAHYGLYLPDQETLYPARSLPLARALRGEAVAQTEFFVRSAAKPGGAWLLVSARPLRDEAGVPLGAVSVLTDVTRLKDTEAAMRGSEEKYRSLYNQTPVMMHSIDRRGRLISVSDYWLTTLGYERSEVVGHDSVEFLTPESSRYAREVVLPAYFKTGECRDVPYQFVKKDGGRLDVLLSAIAERDESGKVVRSLAVLIDVTERKRAEEALRESEQRLRAILDNAPAVFFLLDARERYIFVNREWESLFHRSREEVAGRTVFDLFPRDIASGFCEGNQAVLETGMPLAQEERVPQDDGLHLYLTHKFPLSDATGARYAICGISTDITERKRAEVSQRFLAEASRELVTSLDYETTLQRVAELAVPRLADLCAVFVLEAGAVLRPVAVADRSVDRARRVREFLQRHPPAPGAFEGPARVLSTGRSESSPESRGLLDGEALEDGQWEVLRTLRDQPSISVPLRARGRILGVLSVVSARPDAAYSPADLTLIEELGRRAAYAIDNAELYCKSQESIRARDEFLSIASHELKTPLTSMKLRAQQMAQVLVRQRDSPQLADKVSDMLGVFEEQLKRLSHLVDHLLDVSRINESRLDLRLEEFNLVTLARGVASHLSDLLDKAGCELEVVAPEPVRGRWDRLRMEQVLLNLLTNALKYGAGRPIRLEVTREEGERARMRVEDHGMGIPREAQARIFERFERAASRNYGGLGLGLFITRQLVEAHGGSIHVESEPGQGAVFIVELPRWPSG